MNRKWVMIEKEKEYYEIANKRIEDSIMNNK
jgi:DNA modification methylase